MKDRVRAVVRVELDIEADSVWSTDTTWDQIVKQAEDSVSQLLISRNPLVSKEIASRIISMRLIEVRVRAEGK